MSAIWIVLGLAALAVGLLGTVYPAIPGLGLMFGGAWLLAYAGNYEVVGSGTLVFLGTAAALGMAADYVAGMLGAKFTGASKTAVWGALIGGIAGAFFSLPGLLLGPLLGAGAGEFWVRRDLLAAGKVGAGTFAGFIVGVAAKLGCALVIVFTLAAAFILHLFR